MNSFELYTPLKVAGIKDGMFLADLEEKFREVQEALCRYVDRYGDRDSAGTKATLTVKITLAVEKTGTPSIKVAITKSLPSEPMYVAGAMFGSDDHGPCLKVQRAGAYQGSPQQRRLCTEDGRRIDLTTGEVLDDGTPDLPAGDGDEDPSPFPQS
jgi:hypothetical protein